jgi:hypothetical protein
MYGEVSLGINARRAEAERVRKDAELAKEQARSATQNDFLAKMNSGKLTAKDVLNSNLEAFGSGSKEQFLGMLKTNSESRLKTDPATYTSLFNRIHLPEGDPKKITNENDLNKYFGRGLDMSTLNALRGEIQKRRTPEGEFESNLMKQARVMARSKIVRDPVVGVDPEGEQQMLLFDAWFGKEVQKRKEKGEDAAEFLDPSSHKYILKDMSRFQRTSQEVLRSMTSARGGSAFPSPDSKWQEGETGAEFLARTRSRSAERMRKEGESPAQYLARMKDLGSAPKDAGHSDTPPPTESKTAPSKPKPSEEKSSGNPHQNPKKEFTEWDNVKVQLGIWDEPDYWSPQNGPR